MKSGSPRQFQTFGALSEITKQENVEHCGGEPEQAATTATLHTNRLSFTLKWAESVAFMSAIYARALPETVSNRRV